MWTVFSPLYLKIKTLEALEPILITIVEFRAGSMSDSSVRYTYLYLCIHIASSKREIDYKAVTSMSWLSFSCIFPVPGAFLRRSIIFSVDADETSNTKNSRKTFLKKKTRGTLIKKKIQNLPWHGGAIIFLFYFSFSASGDCLSMYWN